MRAGSWTRADHEVRGGGGVYRRRDAPVPDHVLLRLAWFREPVGHDETHELICVDTPGGQEAVFGQTEEIMRPPSEP